MRQILKNLSGIFLATLFLVLCPSPGISEDYGPTARGIFTILPPTIFEVTQEGLTDADKQDLLTEGKSEFWELAAETPDVLVFASLPFRDRAIGLRIFRNDVDGSVETAIGTLGEPVCAMELWRFDTAGRLVPVDTPPEPEIREFFRKGRKIPKHLHPSVSICLGSGGLVARPVFWDKNGSIVLKLDNEIRYIWTGNGFKKESAPVPALEKPENE